MLKALAQSTKSWSNPPQKIISNGFML